MAVTAHTFDHTAKLYANQEVSLANLKLMKLSALTAPLTATVTISIASPGVVTWTAHGLKAGLPVIFSTTANLPAGLVPGVTYYVKNPTTNTFEVAATQGGASINTSGSQSGTHTGVVPFNMAHTGIASVSNGSSSAVTISNASPGVVTWNGHGLSANNPVVLYTTGALPTGLTPLTVYYVKNPATNTFELSATPGGASINTSSVGSGTHTALASGSWEVHGNGWGPFGPTVANVAGSVITTNDAKLAGDQTTATATGGAISARFMVLYDFASRRPLIGYDLGQLESAGDTTDFKVTFDLLGVPGTIFTITNPE